MNAYAFAKSFLLRGDARSVRAKKNISVAFITKIASILVSFIIVPLTLGYVGKVEYGIWMAISSIIHWFAFFDIGLGNGLRNKLSEALAMENFDLARTYISSAYAVITAISVLMFTGFFIGANFLSWNNVLNTDVVPNQELFVIVTMVFFFFCIGFVMKLVTSILAAKQLYSLNDIIGLVAQVLGLAAIFILVKTTDGSLFNLCLVYGSKSAIVMLITSVILFSGSLKKLKPSIRYVSFSEAKPLLNLGGKFFINQILYLIVYKSSVFLVVHFFGPEDVTVYQITYRYMTLGSMVFIMVLSPYLTAFTEAYAKNEFNWIKSIIRKIIKVWVLMSVGVIVMVLINKLFFRLWVGSTIVVPQSLIVAFALSSILGMLVSTYTLFLNGIGKIKIQLYTLSIQAVTFIPLSYLFYRLGFGLSSLVAVNIIYSGAGLLLFKMQYLKIINRTAIGIWDK